MNLGFIGFGEAAFHISIGLGQEGLKGILAYDALANDPVMGNQVKNRADAAGVVLKENAKMVVSQVDILFTAVPSSFTLDVCKEVSDSLRADQLYIDVSASTPAIKKQIWEIIKGTGVLFVDAAMLGSLPADKHRVPISASGNGVQAFLDIMSPYGMQIKNVGDNAGDASAIKLVRSIFTKGLGTLALEMLQAADAYNVIEQVVASVRHSMEVVTFLETLSDGVIGNAIHAKRRAAEMKGCIQMLGECGLDDCMTVATKHKLEMLDAYQFNAKYVESKPDGYAPVIEALRRKPDRRN
jgi:3-hydroxyisobutyrate dehydrogenase-like beta-hydroxyacid dehydrogenase